MELAPALKRNWTSVALAMLLVTTAAAYLPSIRGEFVLDDDTLLKDPLVTRPLANGPAAWFRNARPLLAATFALNYAVVGHETRGWHATNVVIHLAAVLLAWRLARRLLERAGLERPEGPALAVAALFALHPLQTEAVSYVVQRGESFASAGYMACLLLLLAREDATSSRRRGWLLAATLGLHALGLLTKLIAATLPAAWLLLLATLPSPAEKGFPVWRRVAHHLPEAAALLALSAAAVLWGLSLAAGTVHTGFDMPDVGVAQYLATELRVIPTYLRLLAWPAGQSIDWAFPFSPGLLDPAAMAGAAFLATLCGASLWIAQRALALRGDARAVARLTGFGVPFFLVVLAPSSSLVPLHDPLAEHRVYLAAFGLLLVAVAAAALAVRRLAPDRALVAGTALTLVLAGALGTATFQRNRTWTTLLALYQDAAVRAPEKARVQSNLGLGLASAGRHAEAITCFRNAMRLAGDRTVEPVKVLRNLAASLMALGMTDAALGEIDQFLIAHPDDPRALGFRGFVRYARGHRAEGMEDLRRSLALLPGDPQTLVLLANVEFVSGRYAEAAAAATGALQREPDNAVALEFLGLSSARLGDLATARDALRGALQRGRAAPSLVLQLGTVEERLGDRAGACRTYLGTLARTPDPTAAALLGSAAARLQCR